MVGQNFVAPTQKYLSIKGAALYATVSRATVERWLRNQALRAYRPGGGRRVLISVAELNRLIASGGE
jgi:excisionase family DNA binding protein